MWRGKASDDGGGASCWVDWCSYEAPSSVITCHRRKSLKRVSPLVRTRRSTGGHSAVCIRWDTRRASTSSGFRSPARIPRCAVSTALAISC